MKITVGQVTDRGANPKREVNEDNLLVMPKRGLFLVADGVGGRRGGQVASQTVVDVFTRVFTQEHTDDLRDLVSGTIDLCNQKIYAEAEINPELQGMATTVALLAIQSRRAIVAHVGDSRVYRFDEQGLICLTEDHSEVNEALRAGTITEEQAVSYPRRNVISRALGADINVEPDIIEIEVDERTSFLLCSDGITRHITDEEIARLLRSGRRPEAICETMKDLCYAGGAEDNLTAVIVNLGEREFVEEATRPAPKAARAKAAPASGMAAPRSTRRIEVDLTGPPAVETQMPRPVPSNHRAKGQVSDEAAKTPRPQPVTGKLSGEAASKGPSRRLPKKGELPTVMKWSLLFVTLLAGIIVGSIFAKPITERYDNLFGSRGVYNKTGERPPANAEVSASYARFLEGKPDEARQRLNQILAAHTSDAEAHFYLGRIDYAEGKYESAIDQFNQALVADPNLPDVRIHMAMAYLSIGQQRNARDILQQIIVPSSSPATGLPSPAPSVSPNAAKPVG